MWTSSVGQTLMDSSRVACCSSVCCSPAALFHTAARIHHSPYTDPYDGSAKQAPELTLVPEVGKPAKATIVNIYAGKVSHCH